MKGADDLNGKQCPWCWQVVPELVPVMYLTERCTILERVCPDCRKKWMKRLKQAVGK